MKMLVSDNIKLIVPKNDVTLSLATNVDKICKPLRKFGITFFNYLKICADGSISDLNNHSDLTEFFYYKSNWYQSFSPIINDMSFKSGFILDSTLPEQDYFNDTRDRFDVDHIVFFIIKQNESTVFWQFGTSAGNHKILNFYLNNTEFLKSFIGYFEEEGKRLIQLSDENKYKIILPDDNRLINNLYDANEIQNNIRKFKKIKNEMHLTPKEISCLKLCAEGSSAKMISTILNISTRTVEAHIFNMKMKLGCRNTVELVTKAIRLGYL